jgi:heavy metal response regulator
MRVLVVEDDEKVARFIVRGLREESYAVDHTVNGKEAIGLASVNEYDVIVLDVMIPGRNGFEVAAALREAKVQTPILMLTVKDRTEDKVQGLDAGADDYLTKPFAFAELLARLRALLRRRSVDIEPALTAADLVLDPSTHTVTRAGRGIELTPKEFGLLDFLLRNKGRVVTRTAIIEHVWDMHFDSDTNLVEVFIRYLRRKIDDEFEPKLIHTVRGVGYQLKDEP